MKKTYTIAKSSKIKKKQREHEAKKEDKENMKA